MTTLYGFWHTDGSGPSGLGAAGFADVDKPARDLAQHSRLRLGRVYLKGTPTIDETAGRVMALAPYADYVQLLNEPTLEGFTGSYAQFYKDVRDRVPPDVKLAWAGQTPANIDGYNDAAGANAVVIHVYGQTLDSLLNLTAQIMQRLPPGMPVIVGECNFGPGPNIHIDRDAWSTVFLNYCVQARAKWSNILAVLYFAWTWHADTPIATPVDAKGTKIADVVQSLQSAPQETHMLPDWAPFAVRKPIQRNYSPTRNFGQNHSLLVVQGEVKHIAVGFGSLFNWFNRNEPDPNKQTSAHGLVMRDGTYEQYVSFNDTAYGNGIVEQPDLNVPWIAQAVRDGTWMNAITVSTETEGNPGDPLTEAQVQTHARVTALLAQSLGYNIGRDHIVGHYQIDNVNKHFCPSFSDTTWNAILMAAQRYLKPSLTDQQKADLEQYLFGPLYGFANSISNDGRLGKSGESHIAAEVLKIAADLYARVDQGKTDLGLQ